MTNVETRHTLKTTVSPDEGFQNDIRMRPHRLLQLDDNKSAASSKQARCRLVKTFEPQAR